MVQDGGCLGRRFVSFFYYFFVGRNVDGRRATRDQRQVTYRHVFPYFRRDETQDWSANVVVLRGNGYRLVGFVGRVGDYVSVRRVIVKGFFSVGLIRRHVRVSVRVAFLVEVFAVAGLFLFFRHTARDQAFAAVGVIGSDEVVVEEGDGHFFYRPATFLT